MSLIVADGIKDGADVAKGLAMGADAVAIGTAAMVAMGCNVCLSAIRVIASWASAHQDPELRKRLDIERGAAQGANLLTAMTNEAVILAKACRQDSLRNLARKTCARSLWKPAP